MSQARRLLFHSMLVDILGSDNVYFQIPRKDLMSFPCIKYELNDIEVNPADNINYIYQKRYMVTVIDEDPDSLIPDKVGQLISASFDRFYTSDNLNHFVFLVYF